MDYDTALKVLEVDRHDTYETMRSAFRRVALRHHPDKCLDDHQATRSFQLINEAWQCIQKSNCVREQAQEESHDCRTADRHAATRRARDALEQLRREVHEQEEWRRQQDELRCQQEAPRRPPFTHATRPSDGAYEAIDAVMIDAERMTLRAKSALEQLRRHLHQEREEQHTQSFECVDVPMSACTPQWTARTSINLDQADEKCIAATRARNALGRLQRSAAALSLQCAARRHLSRRQLQQLRQCAARLRCPICLEMKTVDSLETTSCAHHFCRPCLASWMVGQPQATCPICRTELHRGDEDAGSTAKTHEADGEETESEWEDAREYLSDEDAEDEDTSEATVTPEKMRPTANDQDVNLRVDNLSIIAKLHQHGYDKRVAASAMYALRLPALDWTEHHLRRAVEYIELR